jgi:CRISPR-associated protein Cmr2
MRQLVGFTIGGVQEFIDQSRTTVDFHNASTLISSLVGEICRQFTPDEVIFPVTGSGQTPPNSLILLLDEVPDFEGLVDAWWKTERERSQRLLSSAGLLLKGAGKIWNRQTAQCPFETFWVATEWPDAEEYHFAYRRLSMRLESCKMMRRFKPSVEKGIKCSRSGQGQALSWDEEGSAKECREYWRKAAEARGALRHRFRAEEPLSGVSVIRRLAEKRRVPSTSDLAARPFRRRLEEKRKELATIEPFAVALGKILAVLESNTGGGPAAVGREDEIEGGWFFKESYDFAKACKEYGLDARNSSLQAKLEPLLTDCRKSLADLIEEARALKSGAIPPPCPYIAILMADGDRVGDLVTSASRAGLQEHRNLSSSLSDLGGWYRLVMEDDQHFEGLHVYSGGDDLLGFAPGGRAVQTLNRCLEGRPEWLAAKLTLSGVVLLLPHTDPLAGAVRECTELLKEQAKSRFGRQCLLVAARRQSSQTTFAALPWTPDESSAVQAFLKMADWMAMPAGEPEALSGRFVSQWSQLAPSLGFAPFEDLFDLAMSLLTRHVRRMGAEHEGALEALLQGAFNRSRHAKEAADPVLPADLLSQYLVTARFLSRLDAVRGGA